MEGLIIWYWLKCMCVVEFRVEIWFGNGFVIEVINGGVLGVLILNIFLIFFLNVCWLFYIYGVNWWIFFGYFGGIEERKGVDKLVYGKGNFCGGRLYLFNYKMLIWIKVMK